MYKQLGIYLTCIALAAGTSVSAPALADPDLPDPPKPGDLPEPDDLPGVDTDKGTWWDPLGLFADDDDDDHRGKGKGHNKHNNKHHKDK